MKKYLSIASFVSAIIFAALGMWMPPQGEISGSVLILVAQLLVLSATFLGSPLTPQGGIFNSEWLAKNSNKSN